MSNERQQVYTIIAMTKRFLNPEQTEATNPQTYQVLISSADRQREIWLTIDHDAWENFTLGDTVVYEGHTLWFTGAYPNFPIVAEAA